MRKSLLAAFCLLGLGIAGNAAAKPAHADPSPGSWASELVQLANLVQPGDAACTDHCWVLERLKLSGAIDKGKVDFELSGELLQKGSYEIPLFSPADKVRLEGVTENGAPATIGFEDGHWYVHTSAPKFTVRGKLVLPEDRTVGVVGPLDALDADVTGGRITEGAHLSAVANTQLHFDAEGAPPPAQPPVFSIARALRVGKNIEFEYRLTAQSGNDLGVVHLPLRYGERVLDVAGSTGWRVEGEDLLLPTTGKNAEITITGTIANVATFSPDPRAPFEWWLLESDAEHRVLATGDAKQHDAGESPIVRREPNSRLFLVQRGQHLDVTVQTLQSVDVLAATIRSHSRMLVLTSAGDLVAQDTFTYDNNGLDYLYFTPDGKPLYLATDGASERVMHKDGSEELMVPMRLGQHSVTVQTLGQTSIGSLFGRLAMPGPRVPLATASEDITVGLPEAVHPIVVTGGDHTSWPFSAGDLVALALAALASALAFSGWKKRALGTATMLGLWIVAKPLFVLALAAGVIALAYPLYARLGKITRRVTLGVLLLGGFVLGASLLASRNETMVASKTLDGTVAFDARNAKESDALEQKVIAHAAQSANGAANLPEQAAQFGLIGKNDLGKTAMLDGVRPVALSMPGYARTTSASRQLVTPSRTFQPVVYYVTDGGLALLGLAWLACAAGLAWLSRDRLRALRDKLRAALAPKTDAPVTAGLAEQKA